MYVRHTELSHDHLFTLTLMKHVILLGWRWTGRIDIWLLHIYTIYDYQESVPIH